MKALRSRTQPGCPSYSSAEPHPSHDLRSTSCVQAMTLESLLVSCVVRVAEVSKRWNLSQASQLLIVLTRSSATRCVWQANCKLLGAIARVAPSPPKRDSRHGEGTTCSQCRI